MSNRRGFLGVGTQNVEPVRWDVAGLGLDFCVGAQNVEPVRWDVAGLERR
jgi:hypothetical protein